MKDKEHLEKSIRDLKVRLQSGDQDAKMEVDTQEAKLREVDQRLAKEFLRGQESGRIAGIDLGKKQAQTAFQQVSTEYESRLAKYESELKLARQQEATDESKLRSDLQRMRVEMEAEKSRTQRAES